MSEAKKKVIELTIVPQFFGSIKKKLDNFIIDAEMKVVNPLPSRGQLMPGGSKQKDPMIIITIEGLPDDGNAQLDFGFVEELVRKSRRAFIKVKGL